MEEAVICIINAALAIGALVFGAKILRSTRGGMGGSWKWLVAGLAVFAVTMLYRVERAYFNATGSGIKLSGVSEILELVYITLVLIGIFVQVRTYRSLFKAQ